MARQHGMDVRVYLGTASAPLWGKDVSGDLVSISPSFSAEMHDVTTFDNTDWKSEQAGLYASECAIEGFYQPGAATIGGILESLGSQFIIMIFDGDADAIGDTGILLPPSVFTQRGQPIAVGDLIKLSGSFQGVGRPGLFAKLLSVLATKTGDGQATGLDNAASSANGGRGTVVFTNMTGAGTWTVGVQHSTDNSSWVDLITFSGVGSATTPSAQAQEVTGTVNRYLRANWGQSGGTSITFVVGFARYP